MNATPKHYYRFRFRGQYEHAVVAICAFDPRDRPIQLGTGFFVADGGVLATVAHLFTQLEGFTSLFAVQRLDERQLVWHPLGQPSVDHHHDVAVVRVRKESRDEGLNHPVLSIMSLEPEINEISGAFGFPRTSIAVDDEEGTTTTTFNLTYAAGRVLDLVASPVPFIPGGAYITNFALDSGGSGGPVFNSNGFVTAIYSTGVVDRREEDGGPSSSVVAIRHVFNLLLPDETGGHQEVGTLIRGSAGWRGRRPNVTFERYEPKPTR